MLSDEQIDFYGSDTLKSEFSFSKQQNETKVKTIQRVQSDGNIA